LWRAIQLQWRHERLEWQQIVILPTGRRLTDRRTTVPFALARELDGASRQFWLVRCSPSFTCQMRGF
jgi:hypothetical protein